MTISLSIIVLLAILYFTTPAIAEDLTIPIDEEYLRADNMKVHFSKVTITDRLEGQAFTSDPEHSKFPKLYFTYENLGNVANNGHLSMAFVDDKGNVYRVNDVTMDPIQPGKTSDRVRFLEVAVPKNVTITKFVIYEGSLVTEYPIKYKGETTPIPGNNNPAGSKAICCLSSLLPLLVVGTAFKAARKH
ncbi:MAG: hypothetical protein ACM3QV_00365 [Caulobacteraceae bacterium]